MAKHPIINGGMAGKSSLQCSVLYYGSLCLQCLQWLRQLFLTVTLSLENKKSGLEKVYEPCL